MSSEHNPLVPGREEMPSSSPDSSATYLGRHLEAFHFPPSGSLLLALTGR